MGDTAGGDARYRVTFQATWSAETHPTNFPANPHFSGLVGATHNENTASGNAVSLPRTASS